MFCVQCGASNDSSAAACAACGHTAAGGNAGEVGKRVSEAVSDAGAALVRLAPNPTGALAPAYASLGETRALSAGVAMGAAFALATLVASWIASARIGFGVQPRVLFGAFLVGAVFFASLAATAAASRKLLRGNGTLGGDAFLAGVALQPIAIFLLVASLLGGNNFEVIAFLAVLAWTYLLTILYVGVTRLGGVPEAFAPPAVAVMLVLSLWLSKVVLVAITDGSNPLGTIFN